MYRRQLLLGMTALGLAKDFNLNDLLTPQDIETAGWQANKGEHPHLRPRTGGPARPGQDVHQW
jgi:hypothetical protein